MSKATLELKNVSKLYRVGKKEVHALNPISFDLLGDSKGRPISYNEKTDMASTEHNYDLKDSKGDPSKKKLSISLKLE